MNAISVRRFGNQNVAAFDNFRIAQQRKPAPTKIAGKDDSAAFVVLDDLDLSDRRPENVPGI